MYKHVIVPFGGGLEARAAFAPAADLAWRCGAKVVIVSTTAIEDDVVKHIVKSQAIAKSGADVDFWVDLGTELGDALLDAVKFRPDAVICLVSRYRTTGVVRKKQVATPLPEVVLRRSSVPVLVIGPETDLSRGLPMTAIHVPIDETPEAARAVAMAGSLATELRLGVRLLYMAPPGAAYSRPPAAVKALVSVARSSAPDVTLDVIETARPAAALVAIAAEDPDGIILLPGTGGDEHAPLGPFAREVVDTSKRAVLLAAPGV
jgi:hypothetical protein